VKASGIYRQKCLPIYRPRTLRTIVLRRKISLIPRSTKYRQVHNIPSAYVDTVITFSFVPPGGQSQNFMLKYNGNICKLCRFQWAWGLGVGLRPLACWVASSNPAGAMDVSCEWCQLSSRGLCVCLITYPEASYRAWSV